MINRGKRSKTLNEVKPVEKINKNPGFCEKSKEELVDSSNFLEGIYFMIDSKIFFDLYIWSSSLSQEEASFSIKDLICQMILRGVFKVKL